MVFVCPDFIGTNEKDIYLSVLSVSVVKIN